MRPNSPEMLLTDLATKFKSNESDIRIKYGVSNRVIYGQLGKGFRNELDDAKLSVMVEAMQQSVNADLKEYRHKKPSLEIKINDQTVFRQEKNGAITVNQVQLEQETASPSTSLQAEPDIATGLEQIESEAARNQLANVLEHLNLPPTFVEAAKQIQQLPRDNVRELLTDWVSTVSKDAFVAVNQGTTLAKNLGDRVTEQFKNLQNLATNFSGQADKFSKKATEQVNAIQAWQAEQMVAQTALRIYKHHHERMFKDAEYRQQHSGAFNTFKGQKYTLTHKGNHLYELSSTETQQVLMQFKDTFWRLEVKDHSNHLQPQDYREFAQIKEKLARLEPSREGNNHGTTRKRQEMALNG